ncbi:MAG: hypothetical protein IJ553_00845 [Alloprevotella sp.]|nr:hypothetical protein [Alloprevotella sp.]
MFRVKIVRYTDEADLLVHPVRFASRKRLGEWEMFSDSDNADFKVMFVNYKSDFNIRIVGTYFVYPDGSCAMFGGR